MRKSSPKCGVKMPSGNFIQGMPSIPLATHERKAECCQGRRRRGVAGALTAREPCATQGSGSQQHMLFLC